MVPLPGYGKQLLQAALSCLPYGIQLLTDAYYSRCLKGFHMSGQAPYGFELEPTVVEGIRTKMMAADPVAANHVRLMFEMYAEPETSFGDITRYFEEQGIKIYGKSLTRPFLSQLLRNPVYAQADLEMYEFFKSQGTVVVNDAADFAGTNGCYANKKIEDLDNRRKTLSKAIADLSVETLSSQQIELLSGYLDDWENISFEDKRKAADGLISSISATSDYVKIEWKI